MFFDAETAQRVPNLMYALAISWAVLAFIAVFLIKNKELEEK